MMFKSNIKEIIDKLKTLPKRVQNRLSKDALNPEMKNFRDASRAAAPRDTGLLAKNIVTKVGKRKVNRVSINVIVKNNPALIKGKKKVFYPAVVEYGRKKNRTILKKIIQLFTGNPDKNVGWQRNLFKQRVSAMKTNILSKLKNIISQEIEGK